MIAVFTEHPRPFLSLDASPDGLFRVVYSVGDIGKSHYIGVMHIGDWFKYEEAVKAHKALRRLQPELFKDVRGSYY